MIIKNADIFGQNKCIVIKDGIIEDVLDCVGEGVTADIDMQGQKVIPGLVDIHTHGIMGIDTMDKKLGELAMLYAKFGTTTFLPTTMTKSVEEIEEVTSLPLDYPGAKIPGFHLEGPYISEKYKGAQKKEFIKDPNYDEFLRFKNVKKITLAPEKNGSMEFIKKASKTCSVSIGHTDCDFETACKAIDNGANCLTHTFNAMQPLHHRKPGPIGACIEKNCYAEVICDGFHVQKPLILMLYRTLTADRLVFISDSIRPAKCKEGKYEAGGLEVTLKDGRARLADGTIAGSTSTLFECVKTAVSFGIPFKDAVKMASATPAKLIGIKAGEIKKGYSADLILLDKNDEIDKVLINGKTI